MFGRPGCWPFICVGRGTQHLYKIYNNAILPQGYEGARSFEMILLDEAFRVLLYIIVVIVLVKRILVG